jgi:alkylation response protein AidB-like acyl-CoA dehydrogenase
MSGRANFNEIFFDNVPIPDEHRVGEVNDGWSVAVTTLLHERLSISAGVGMGGQKDHPASLEALRRTLDTSDPLVRDELVELHIRSRALALFNQRLAQETRAGIFPGARGSAAKLLLAELTLYQADLATRLVGPEAALAGHPLARAISMAPGMALGGGTNEIMRNIVGDRVLGLPPEPRVDKNVPFKDLKVGTQA